MSYLVPYGGRGRNLDWMRRFFDEDALDAFFGGDFFGNAFKADIRERENEYILEAEMPGVRKDQISIHYENNVLTVGAKQLSESNEENGTYLRRERYFGEMRRSFMLENIDEDRIQAEYREGLLRVVLPKDRSKEQRRKNIDIH
jgi:HSP20 family protein